MMREHLERTNRATPNSKSRLALLLSVALISAVLAVIGSPASAADGAGASTESPSVTYEHEDALSNSDVVVIEGNRVGTTGCEFPMPELKLDPGQDALEARQVWADYGVCTTGIEIGEPRHVEEELPDGGTYEEVTEAVSEFGPKSGGTRIPLSSSTTTKGYYKLYWQDFLHITTTQSQVVITWTWNGTSVTSASGSTIWYWLSATGWSKTSGSTSQTTTSSYTKRTATAAFKNTAFPVCIGTVRTYHNGVWVKGTKSGSLYGATTSTYTTYPLICPTLHYHTSLVRVYG